MNRGSASNLEFSSEILLSDWKLTKELDKELHFVDILGQYLLSEHLEKDFINFSNLNRNVPGEIKNLLRPLKNYTQFCVMDCIKSKEMSEISQKINFLSYFKTHPTSKSNSFASQVKIEYQIPNIFLCKDELK